MAAAFVATALACGPLLQAPSAYAEDGNQGGRASAQTVDFVGGSLLDVLMCRSQPSAERLDIPAESRVMFVNRLGQNAVLRVNGKAVAQVGPSQAVPVVFHRGPVSVTMTFPCGIGVDEQFASTAVAVATVVRPAAPPAVAPAPPPTVSPTVAPTPNPSPKAHTSRFGRDAASSPQAGTGALAAVAADPPAASRSPAPVTSATATPVTADLAAVDGGNGAGPVAVEPLVRVSATSQDGSSGVLALAAAVCAVGVTVAVIRAIITKPNKPSVIRA